MSLNRPKIMIVEDNAVSLLVYKQIVKDLNYEFTFCDSSKLALELLKTHTFDGVITDMLMPDISGLELLLSVKDLPLFKIMITGSTELSSILFAVNEVGVDKILIKPLDLNSESVEQLIQSCLSKKEAVSAA